MEEWDLVVFYLLPVLNPKSYDGVGFGWGVLQFNIIGCRDQINYLGSVLCVFSDK